ncbi:MAG: D-aminoacyl-tRNA deacylase [Clostridia bacterium]|nr:D-aminoacyl-tRNA deacylase [Clostridia bacterium]
MKAVIQRVAHCEVVVDEKTVGKISQGFLILLGVENGDTQKDAEKLSAKISGLRIFTDENDKMNLSLVDINGEVLVVSNFTLCADCRKGRRPNFENAERPEKAEPLYEYFCNCMKNNGINKVEKGIFGADMKVSLLNDGPVTIIINSKDLA